MNTETDIEEAKLAFERDKLKLEEHWRKRTYAWTIASGFLTAVVTLGVAWISIDDDALDSPSKLVAAPIEACRDSLRRLDTLALSPGQAIDDLIEAIGRHKNQCNDVLVHVITQANQ